MSKTLEKTKSEKEVRQLVSWRTDRYLRLLGSDWPEKDILKLLKKGVDHHELEYLLKRNCPKKIAIKILL